MADDISLNLPPDPLGNIAGEILLKNESHNATTGTTLGTVVYLLSWMTFGVHCAIRLTITARRNERATYRIEILHVGRDKLQCVRAAYEKATAQLN